MKNALFLLSWSFLFIACGKKETRFEVGQEHVHAFEKASKEVGHPVAVDNLIIQLGETGVAAANCVWGSGTPELTIKRDFWVSASDVQREIIVFHEMGHCILNRDHLDSRRADGTPQSLMNTYAVTAREYKKARSYYIQELFTVKK